MSAFFWIFGFKVANGVVLDFPDLDAKVFGTPIKPDLAPGPAATSSLTALVARDQDLQNLYFVQSDVFEFATDEERLQALAQATAYVTQGDGEKLRAKCANCVLYELAEA